MLSVKDIHFLIDQGLNNGSFLYRDYELEEIDEAVNAVLFELVNNALDKDEKEEVEELLLRALTSSLVYNGQLNADYYKYVRAKAVVYKKDCRIKTNKVENNKVYLAITDVKIDSVWKRAGDTFTGVDAKSWSGQFVEIVSKTKKAIYVDPDSFDSFISIDSVIYTIIGNKIETKSKFPIHDFIFDYVRVIGDKDKIDSTKAQTLPFNETIQRWVIEKTIIKLAIRSEESQQKIVNLEKDNLTK